MYRNLKEKYKQKLEDICYEDTCLEMLSSMFTYTDNPKSLESEYIELFLLTFGMCAIWKNKKNKIIASMCNPTGNIDDYGIGKDLFCVTLNGESKTFKNWKESKEVVVIFNNKYHTRDLNIERYAYFFSEIDTSLRVGIVNTRFSKIQRVQNSVQKTAMEKAINASGTGVPQVVLASDIFDEYENKNNTIELTTPQDSDKLQYLSKLYEDFWRRFFNLYGMTTQGSEKMAQMSSAEINNGSNSELIIPLDRLEERKKGIDKVNNIFDLKMTVDFSTAWKRENEKRNEELETNVKGDNNFD